MPYTVIENFKAGLVRHAHILSLSPGMLYTADNVVISLAGEVVKRKDILRLEGEWANLGYGLVATAGKLYTFGSDALGPVSIRLSYLRCRHPAVLGGAPEGAGHRIEEFVTGCSFQNRPWVVIKFVDQSRWAYYANEACTAMELVGAFRDGLVLPGLTSVASVASHIADMLRNVSGATVEESVDEVSGHSIIKIAGAPSSTLALTIGVTDEEGTDKVDSVLEPYKGSTGESGVPGTPGTAILHLQRVNNGGVLHGAYAGSDALGWTSLIGTSTLSVETDETEAAFAARLTAEINSYQPLSASDFTAYLTNRTIYVSTTALTAADFNGHQLKLVAKGIVFSDCGFKLNGTGSEQISAVVADGTPLISSPVARPSGATELERNQLWAQAVVNAINAGTGSAPSFGDGHGYTSCVYEGTDAGYFIVGKAITISEEASLDVVVTHDGVAGVVEASDVPDNTYGFPSLFLSALYNTIHLPYGNWTGGNAYWLGINSDHPWFSMSLDTPVNERIYVTGGNGTYKGVWRRISGNPFLFVDDAQGWDSPLFGGLNLLTGIQYPDSALQTGPAVFRLEVEDTSVPRNTTYIDINVIPGQGILT